MKFIDLNEQHKLISENVNNRFDKIFNHGQYIMGPEVYELEQSLASYVGIKHCISCSSGTDALLIILMSQNYGPGDAIITTPFTYIATAEVISLLGATPIFIDINKDTFNIDPDLIEQGIEEAKRKNLKPRAIIAVDLFGLPSRYRKLKVKAKKYNLFLIEDAAQSFGSKIRGRKACSFGDASITSFFPSKPLGCYGDGGAIFTDDSKINELTRSIRNHGAGSNRYDNIRLGINGRLDSIQAAILLEKLTLFEDELKARQLVAERYAKNLDKSLIFQYIPKDYSTSWAQYSLLLPDHNDRKKVMGIMKEKSIPTMVYYKTALHLQKVFKQLNYSVGDFKVTESISKKIISLPMHPYLKLQQQDHIIESFNKSLI